MKISKIKTKIRTKTALLLAGLLLVLNGCSLAQPEKKDVRDNRFLGFYLVYDRDENARHEFWNKILSDGESCVNVGSKPLDTEWGRLAFDGMGLPAEMIDGKYTFPGLDGYSFFVVSHGPGPDADGGSIGVASDIYNTRLNLTETDDGSTETSISGILYLGPPRDAGPDWDRYADGGTLTAYRVYETEQGIIYLDGSGNSVGGGAGTYFERKSQTSAVNGEVTEDTVEVTVEVRYAPRLETLSVSQFDGDNNLLCTDEVPVSDGLDGLPEVNCLETAAWALVEERSAEGCVRTAYNVNNNNIFDEGDGETVRHTVVLLDADGRGRTVELVINGRD